MRSLRAFAGAAVFAFFVVISNAKAAAAEDLKVFAPRAIATVLQSVGAQFEQATGAKLVVVSDLGANLVKRINAGEPFDVFSGAPPQLSALVQNGKVIAETRTTLVRSGIAVEVRAGAPKPDISSVDAFKQMLLNAKSIGYLKEGASGVYLSGLLDRLGIANAIKSKITRPDTDIVSEMVAKGEIEVGMVVMTQVLTTPGVQLVGPLARRNTVLCRFSRCGRQQQQTPRRCARIAEVPDWACGAAGHRRAGDGAGLSQKLDRCAL
jgi:molybdate transport system substrate-binding protein